MAVTTQARNTQIGAVLQEGAAAHRAGNLDGAEQAYRRALKRIPNDPDALHLLGVVLNQRGDSAGGLASIRKALDVRDDFPDAHVNLGIMLRKSGNPVAAEQHFRRALRYRPGSFPALSNLAQILADTGRSAESIAIYRAALRDTLGAVEIHIELARIFRLTGDLVALEEAVAAGLRVAPAHPTLQLMASEIAFAQGRLREGWNRYAWQFKSVENEVPTKPYALPRWQGEPLGGKAILVWMEQGVGDELMYANMFPDLLTQAARCAVQCSPRVAPVLRRSFPTLDVFDRDLTAEELGGVDFQSPAGSLGEWLRPDIASFPQQTGYIKADAAKRNALRAKYLDGKHLNDKTGRLIVGLAWRSQAPVHGADKSLSILEWGPILNVPGLTFVNLQYGDCRAELAAVAKGFGVTVIDDPNINSLKSIDDYAAQVAAMDIVVTSSNTAAHVAGALGIPTLCMLPYSSGRGRRWYWFAESGGCPWYPEVRIFLQKEEKHWLSTILSAGIALFDFANARGAVAAPVAYLRALGHAFAALKRPADAEFIYRRMAQESGATAEALRCVGEVQKKNGQNEAALASYTASIAADPTFWHSYNDKGLVQAAIGYFEDAVITYREGLRHKPDSPELRNNIATALGRLGKSREALPHIEEALRNAGHLDAASVNAIALNYGVTLSDEGHTDRAVEVLSRLIDQAPDYVDAHYNRAQTLLSVGRFAEGWPDAEWRLKRPSANVRYESFPPKRWNGESLAGKKILIWTEQGIGDEILTATMIPDAVRTAKHVTVLCSERLIPLMRRSFPEATVEERKEPLPKAATVRDIDFQLSFCDLGRAFRESFDEFPAQAGFLKASPEKTATLRAKYNDGRPLVGLAWSSLKNYEVGWLKSAKLPEWAPILQTPGVRFVSLQYGDRTPEIKAIRENLGVDILQDPDIDGLRDMDGFAAQVAAMDLVISVSNTTVHTAGAIGVPAWVLLSEGRGRLWYWFRDRSDCPWYPSLRLYRQERSGAWSGVIARCAHDLAEWTKSRKRP